MGRIVKHGWQKLFVAVMALCMALILPANAAWAEPNGGQTRAASVSVTVTADKTDPQQGDTVHLTAKVMADGEEVTDLEKAGLQLWWWTDTWNDHTDGKGDTVYSNYGEDAENPSGSGLTLEADVTLPSVGTYYLAVTVNDVSTGTPVKVFDDTVLTLTTTEKTVTDPDDGDQDDSDPVTGDIDVEKVQNLSDDFIMGLDISSVISEFNSGVTYKDFEGNPIDNVTDFCKFLKEDCGITHIRVRVWNDPYDGENNGYGGGNNDVDAAVQIAQGCKAAGLKMLVDFHYSDFWADPGKQQTPKAWSGYSLEQKAEAIKTFTTESLTKIAATGVDIDMVQVGNETTNDFVDAGSREGMCTLFNAGAKAIRDFDEDIRIVIHLTNPERANQLPGWAKSLQDNNVDYDILATSYYPYWHGTLENLKSQFSTVKNTYGKDVMVAETSYAYTLADTDGHENTVRKGTNDTFTSYPFSPQGQADCIRDIIDAVNEAGGLGVYYWEPAWITVGDTTGLSGEELDERVAKNKELWEKHGSGWASSFASEYDPDDAGKWFGGSAVDNQAMFYADGTPTESLHVWEYVKTGAVSDKISVDAITAPAETIEKGGTYTLPETVEVTYNDGTVSEAVTWNEEDIKGINVDIPGKYTVKGTVTFSKEVTGGAYAGLTQTEVVYTLTVQGKEEDQLITDTEAAGFESIDNFEVSGPLSLTSVANDVYEGSSSLHWYSASAATGEAIYTMKTPLEAGWYTLETVSMGASGDTVTLSILDDQGEVIKSGDAFAMTGWLQGGGAAEWPSQYVTFYLEETTSVKLRISVDIQDGGWGSLDQMKLRRHEAFAYTDNGDETHKVLCEDCGEPLAESVTCEYSAAAVADAGESAATVTYRCLCGSEKTEKVTAEIQGITDNVSLTEGGTASLNAKYTAVSVPEGVSLAGTYSSSNDSVVKISANGEIQATGTGNANITYIVKGTVSINGTPKTFTVAEKTVAVTVQKKTGEKPSDPTQPTDPANPDSGNNTQEAGNKSEIPATGDNFLVMLCVLGLGISLTAGIPAGVYMRKKHK